MEVRQAGLNVLHAVVCDYLFIYLFSWLLPPCEWRRRQHKRRHGSKRLCHCRLKATDGCRVYCCKRRRSCTFIQILTGIFLEPFHFYPILADLFPLWSRQGMTRVSWEICTFIFCISEICQKFSVVAGWWNYRYNVVHWRANFWQMSVYFGWIQPGIHMMRY